MAKEYDFLIVGSGLFGATFAQQAKATGKKCLVIEKRNHIGGNTYCRNERGINIHCYGPHIFHTNHKEIWDYVNSFAEFNRFTLSPLANSNGTLYNLPFNMNTFYQLWKTKTPEEAKEKIKSNTVDYINPANLHEQAISLVGKEIYYKLIKGYTEKQWGRSTEDLPAFIIKRLPLRFTYDNNYFNDKYQGVPIGGYNILIERMLEGIQILINYDYLKERKYWNTLADKIVYSGPIDQYYNYRFGPLEYRSLRFEHETLEIENYQGNVVVNYTDHSVPYTRIIEHKHFEYGKQSHTVITKEYPVEWKPGMEAYYPINDAKNSALYDKYKELAAQESNVIFGGRLGTYKYYDMHQVIASALRKFIQNI